jgi:hypothetical protein
MITISIDSQKFQDYLGALAKRTSREMPVFIRGQAFSLVTKIAKEMKSTKKRQKSIRKMFAFYRRLKEGKSKVGVIVHEKAQKMAEQRAPLGFANLQTRDDGEKLGRLRNGREGDSRTKKLSRRQLAVRYEFGLRRKGVGATRAGWIEAIHTVDPYKGGPAVTFSKSLSNPRSPKTWAAKISKGNYSFHGTWESDGFQNPAQATAIQRGVDKTSADMERHFFKKTGDLLKGYK